MSEIMPHGSSPATAAFTCNSCGIKFVTAEFQRAHMKTDWHRYNLKRKVAALPPISSDVFAHKILQQKKLAELEGEVDEFGFPIKVSKKTEKKKKMSSLRGRLTVWDTIADTKSRDSSPASVSNFSEFSLGESEAYESTVETGSEANYSERSEYETDFNSTTDDEHDTDVVESDMESLDEYVQVVPISQCFFCGAKHSTVDENVDHMFSTHGLYIPERAYLADLSGLLTFVSEVITLDHDCLVCGFRGRSVESVRQHMDCKGHCRIPYETQVERDVISEFYDFTGKCSTSDQGDKVLVRTDALTRLRGDLSTLRLPSGISVNHRSSARTRHLHLALAKREESQRTAAVADRRLAPGVNYRTATRFEKSSRRAEKAASNIHERQSKLSRINFKRSFRDSATGSVTAL